MSDPKYIFDFEDAFWHVPPLYYTVSLWIVILP